MKANDLTTGHIGSKILFLALPLIITNLMQVSYNFVDMYFIGLYLPNGEGVTALGTAGNYNWLCTSYIMFATIGTQVLIAQSYGAKQFTKQKIYTISGIFFTFILASVYSIITFIFSEPLIDIFGITDQVTHDYAVSYLHILSVALFFIMMNMVFTAIYQALGKTNMVFLITGIGVIVNIILDPLFIFVLDYGVDGAAYATLIGAMISSVIYLFILVFRTDLLRGKILIKLSAIKDIFKIGGFVGTQNVLFTASAMVITAVILEFGDDALGAQRIGSQIESFTWMVGGGISAVISSFTAQNFGAKDILRVEKGYRFTMIVMTVYGLLISAAFIVWGDVLISLFTNNDNIIDIGAEYLRILAFSQLFMLYEGISGGVFNGLGMSKYVAIYGISGNVGRIIFVFILSSFMGINGIWVAITVSSIYKGLGLTIHLFKYMKTNYNVTFRSFLKA